MSLNKDRCEELLKQIPELERFRSSCSDPSEPLENYKNLEKIRSEIDPQVYAYCLRGLLQMNTKGVSVELRLAMLEGVCREDIMYQDELDKFAELPDTIVIYRGTTIDGAYQGLSWSPKKDVAEGFFRGALLEAKINKNEIIAYFSDQNEDEILAYVKEPTILEEKSNYGESWQSRLIRELSTIPGVDASQFPKSDN